MINPLYLSADRYSVFTDANDETKLVHTVFHICAQKPCSEKI